jgi:hypothetical protein
MFQTETQFPQPNVLPTVQTDYESCPTCGQEIPPEKLKEISGRIAVKEREKAQAISAQLEARFATERSQAEAQSKAEIDAVRKQSAIREARARDEAEQAAQKVIGEKLAEVERIRQEELAKSKEQIDAAELARESAEQKREVLSARLEEVEQTNAAAIEHIKTEAADREAKIRAEAKKAADLEAAAKIADSEAAKTAVEKERAALAQQVEDLRKSKEAEITKVKESSAAEAERIRLEATEVAELRARDTIAAHEKALEEERTKARNAEQYSAELKQNLTSQREIMEKAKDDAVNAERARAFDENQKLSKTVSELQRRLENKDANELGEGAEVDVFEALKAEFRDDKINRVGKGEPGADIRHVVLHRGKECGTILYESKNLKKWCPDHVTKLRRDQVAAKAEHAVLSTHKFPQGCSQVHTRDGIVIVNPARVVAIATILRQHLIQTHTLRLSKVERESKTAALYDFITSEQCTQLLSRIDERAGGLLEMQVKEMRWHESNWKRQGEAIRVIQKSKADLENQIGVIIGTSADDDIDDGGI